MGATEILPAAKRQHRFLETTNEEILLPVIRADLARRLAEKGFRVSEIAAALRVTQPAVTQYLRGRRGAWNVENSHVDTMVNPLAEKLAQKIHSGLTIETAELLETARQIIVMDSDRGIVTRKTNEPQRSKVLELLRHRLRLELDAAEKYLELANRTSEDYTKLLLRMIAADSIRHGDVVSQLMSWLAAGAKSEGVIPSGDLLKSMLSIEDSAAETSLTRNVEVDHPVARLLLQWIDIDEEKHEKMVSGLIGLNTNRKQPTQAH